MWPTSCPATPSTWPCAIPNCSCRKRATTNSCTPPWSARATPTENRTTTTASPPCCISTADWNLPTGFTCRRTWLRVCRSAICTRLRTASAYRTTALPARTCCSTHRKPAAATVILSCAIPSNRSRWKPAFCCTTTARKSFSSVWHSRRGSRKRRTFRRGNIFLSSTCRVP